MSNKIILLGVFLGTILPFSLALLAFHFANFLNDTLTIIIVICAIISFFGSSYQLGLFDKEEKTKC